MLCVVRLIGIIRFYNPTTPPLKLSSLHRRAGVLEIEIMVDLVRSVFRMYVGGHRGLSEEVVVAVPS